MKKRIVIGLLILVFTVACIPCSWLSFGGGPDPKSQQATLEGMLHFQETQNSIIQTQVAQGLQSLSLTQNQPGAVVNPSSNGQSQPGEADAVSAQKTADMERLLTNVPTTTIPQITPDGGFGPSPQPQVDPKGSDGTDFTNATFKAWGQPNYQLYAISIDLTGPVGTSGGKNYTMKVGENLLEKCSTPLEYPNRLYCSGRPFQGGKFGIQVLETVNGQQFVRFSTIYTFPRWTSTPQPATKRPKVTEEED